MKYLIYLRVSTKKQDEKTQLDHCLEYLKTRATKDFDYEVFVDIKTSKKGVFKREGSKKMLEQAKKGDIIVALKLDRLSRISTESHLLIDELEKREIGLILVDQPKLTNKILLGLYAGMAEEEIKLLRERVSQTLATKKRRGERISGQLPYGYDLHPTKLVAVKEGEQTVLKRGILIPLPKEQEAMNLMEELFSSGRSYQNIASALTEKGYLNREGRPFQKMSVYRILSRIKNSKSVDQLPKAKEVVGFC